MNFPACAPCCGGGEPFVTWRCESLTGTAVLCGFSGYDDGSYDGTNSTTQAAWEGQYRKWGEVSMNGTMMSLGYASAGCSGDRACYGEPGFGFAYHTDTTVTWDSSATLDCGSRVDGEVNVNFIINYDCDAALGTYYDYTVRTRLPESSGHYTPITTLTTRTFPGPGCIPETRPYAQRASFKLEGSATDTLGGEVYLYDALMAVLSGGGDVEIGESCCSTLSAASLTTPEDQAPITMTGTAARVRVTVFGIPLAEYNVAIEITRGASVTTVVVGVRGMVPTDFNVPLAGPGTDPYCVTDVYLP